MCSLQFRLTLICVAHSRSLRLQEQATMATDVFHKKNSICETRAMDLSFEAKANNIQLHVQWNV